VARERRRHYSDRQVQEELDASARRSCGAVFVLSLILLEEWIGYTY